jgi:hypothetical protein
MEEAFQLFACRMESSLSFDRRPSRLRGTIRGISKSCAPRHILPKGHGSSRRHRLHDNFLGTGRFCPIVRRTGSTDQLLRARSSSVRRTARRRPCHPGKNTRRPRRPSSRVRSLESCTYPGTITPSRRLTSDDWIMASAPPDPVNLVAVTDQDSEERTRAHIRFRR